MSQKYASYDATGAITGFYDDAIGMPPAGTLKLAITNDQWQACLASPGAYVVDTVAIAVMAAPPVDPTVVLASAKAVKISALQAACGAALVAGFASSALGAPHTYPSQKNDQDNLQSAVAASGGQAGAWATPLWCEDQTGTWAYTAHTAAQVAQVNVDWVAFRTAAQSKYAAAVAQVNAATTADAVAAVSA
ncbi:hypothetical protein [Paraburkholderia sp.]|uniref:DUF4376 domain-containing protein n=1 Tax=Paraburkholderia sp. TaxID=1926495 RepID=UPI0025E019EE|nr:hypothetical protein [Paraburkholderia sp.]